MGPISRTSPSRNTTTVLPVLLGQREVVSDEQNAETMFDAQLVEQLQDASLHGDIERGGGLVGDQQPGFAGDGDRDQHALQLPAGELVRVVTSPALASAIPTCSSSCRPAVGQRPDRRSGAPACTSAIWSPTGLSGSSDPSRSCVNETDGAAAKFAPSALRR